MEFLFEQETLKDILNFLGIVFLFVGGGLGIYFLDTLRIDITKVRAKAKAEAEAFAKTPTGRFVNERAEGLLLDVDDPEDEVVGKIAAGLNKLLRTNKITREQVSGILKVVVGEVIDLTEYEELLDN